MLEVQGLKLASPLTLVTRASLIFTGQQKLIDAHLLQSVLPEQVQIVAALLLSILSSFLVDLFWAYLFSRNSSARFLFALLRGECKIVISLLGTSSRRGLCAELLLWQA